ncbi:MAG: aminoglycoside phosphotransferase [Actinomycetia bacterium]|nr:aminoglycoside phosphotransferase [Actinomycetes bacterium]
MVASGESARVASRLVGRELTEERAITVDQTNHSVIVGDAAVPEQFVVKWLQPPVLSPHPGVQVLGHLASRGFTEMPTYIGSEERDELVLATVTEFVPEAQDGWDWFVDDVDANLRGERTFEDLIASATRMGEITSRMHTALADMQPTTVAARTYLATAFERLDEALRTVHGEEGARLLALVPSVHTALSPLESNALLTAHRIHGDLHAGQFLRARDRLLVTDFDGNPLATGETRLSHSPLIDLASMLQSISHVGCIVVKRRHPDRADDVERFVAAATTAALDAYRSAHPVADDLLHALRVAQELHEYCYAVAHLPRWLYVPDASLPALLRDS